MRFSGKEEAGLALAQEKTTGYPATVFAARLTDSEAIVEDFMRVNIKQCSADEFRRLQYECNRHSQEILVQAT